MPSQMDFIPSHKDCIIERPFPLKSTCITDLMKLTPAWKNPLMAFQTPEITPFNAFMIPVAMPFIAPKPAETIGPTVLATPLITVLIPFQTSEIICPNTVFVLSKFEMEFTNIAIPAAAMPIPTPAIKRAAPKANNPTALMVSNGPNTARTTTIAAIPAVSAIITPIATGP